MNNMTNIAQDKEIFDLISKENNRQSSNLELIASENYVSQQVLDALGSTLTNKYAEGYPGHRYYGGCEYVDEIESLAIERVKAIFGADHANVQPHSGSQANSCVYSALLSPGDTVLSMDLNSGGHLTHGSMVNFSGKLYKFDHYGVDGNGFIDYDYIYDKACFIKPKLIVAGGSSYPRVIDFAKFREIADSVGALLMVDMAHIAGIVAAGLHPNPVKYADVVTSTTHKTLRGPRGGFILCKEKYARKIDSAVFPGTQGGPLMNVIAAKAVCFHEAMHYPYKGYIYNVVSNAMAMAEVFIDNGIDVVTGGTDNHIVLLDLTKLGLNGVDVQRKLEEARITVNKNVVPNETKGPKLTSGIRIGTPAITTIGITKNEVIDIADWISLIILNMNNGMIDTIVRRTKEYVLNLMNK